MGKGGLIRMLFKRVIFPAVLLASFLCLAGCETGKGASGERVGLWQDILKADNWIKENLW